MAEKKPDFPHDLMAAIASANGHPDPAAWADRVKLALDGKLKHKAHADPVTEEAE